MHIEKQFTIFMINKPGVLSLILSELAVDRINIIALTVMDSSEHGVLRAVVAAPEKMRKILAKLNLQYSESEVLCVNLANKSGAFAAIAEKLAKSHINISYAYCTAGARGGRTTSILKVADIKKAMKTLSIPGKTQTKSKPSARRSPASRR